MGPAAAAAMSQIGSTVAQLLIMGTPLDRLFAEADRILALRSLSTMATVGVVVVDSEQHTLTGVSAGHPQPLLVEPDGTARLVESSLRPPLCTFDGDVSPSPFRISPAPACSSSPTGSSKAEPPISGPASIGCCSSHPPSPHLTLDSMVDAFVEALSEGVDDTVVLAAHLGDIASQQHDDRGAPTRGGTAPSEMRTGRSRVVQPVARSDHPEPPVHYGR